MPLYEFRCGKCDSLFETLVPVGTDRHECRECGAEGATRVMSLPSQAPKFVKTAAGNRRQEAENRKLHEATKRDFKRKRQGARDGAKARRSKP